MPHTSPDPLPPAGVESAPQIAALFAEGAVAYQTRESIPADTLLPEEAQFVQRAVPRRVHEFAGGRACARAALLQLGYGRVALPMDAHRAPRWPPGVTGSITHTHGYCAAVVSQIAHIRALGLDVEPVDAVKPHLWRRIFTAAELAALRTQDARTAVESATLMFSAKEAFYKCQHTLTGEWLGFCDISVSIEAGAFRVSANQMLRIAESDPGPWQGRWLVDAGRVITGVCIA